MGRVRELPLRTRPTIHSSFESLLCLVVLISLEKQTTYQIRLDKRYQYGIVIRVLRVRNPIHARHFMFRRPAVLLTSPRDLSNCSLFLALLHQSEAHLFTFQFLAHSSAKTPGCHQSRFSFFGPPRATRHSPANLFRISTYRRRPRFDRDQPKSSVHKPFRINTYKKSRCNPFRIRTYKKPGGGGCYVS
jgi:hypothetical protein